MIPGPLRRRPSHLNDRSLPLYAWPLRERRQRRDRRLVAGPARRPGRPRGRLVRRRRLHQVHAHDGVRGHALLFAAIRDARATRHPLARAEARFGLRLAAARPGIRSTSVLYLQVGIGSGNTGGTFNGDHDLWRLPETRRRADGRGQPLSRATGRRSAPTLRATAAAAEPRRPRGGRLRAGRPGGRRGAARARARRAATGRRDLRRRRRRRTSRAADVVTALPHAFYPESSWRDDLELGGGRDRPRRPGARRRARRHWLQPAARWARAYLDHEAGATRSTSTTRARWRTPTWSGRSGRRTGRRAAARARLLARPARAARQRRGRAPRRPVPRRRRSTTTSMPRRTRSASSRPPSCTGGSPVTRATTRSPIAQRDWALGANPWGVSMMVGVGTTLPRCMQHVVANLSGSRTAHRRSFAAPSSTARTTRTLFSDGLGGFFDNGPNVPGRRRRPLRAVHRSRQPVRRRRALLADRRAGARLHGGRGAGLRAAPRVTMDILERFDEQLRRNVTDEDGLYVGDGWSAVLAVPPDVDRALARLRELPGHAEWKLYGHDPPDLQSRLRAAGMEPDEEEAVLVAEASSIPPPDVGGHGRAYAGARRRVRGSRGSGLRRSDAGHPGSRCSARWSRTSSRRCRAVGRHGRRHRCLRRADRPAEARRVRRHVRRRHAARAPRPRPLPGHRRQARPARERPGASGGSTSTRSQRAAPSSSGSASGRSRRRRRGRGLRRRAATLVRPAPHRALVAQRIEQGWSDRTLV